MDDAHWQLTKRSAGKYGEEHFTLQATYLQGQPPKSVNMHWRRFAIKDIPVGDENSFRDWLLARWREKDALLEFYAENGHFPAGKDHKPCCSGKKLSKDTECIDVKLRPRSISEVLQIFVPPVALILAAMIVSQITAVALERLKTV